LRKGANSKFSRFFGQIFPGGDYTPPTLPLANSALKIYNKTYQTNGLFFNFVAQINRNIKFL
jgi:hypothetical protein